MQPRFCGDLSIVDFASGLKDAPFMVFCWYGWRNGTTEQWFDSITLPCSNDQSWILQQCEEARPKLKFKVWKSQERLVVLTRFDDKHENAYAWPIFVRIQMSKASCCNKWERWGGNYCVAIRSNQCLACNGLQEFDEMAGFCNIQYPWV